MTPTEGAAGTGLSARPRAKLNLTLEVGPREPDDLHSLRSVFLRIGLSDRLGVSPSGAQRDSLALRGPVHAPVEGNLVLRAVELLRQRTGERLPALAMELDKRIPIGAGLGGGSSDAAAALALAQACWGLGIAPAALVELAIALGSDVPFFASGAQVALVEGRGERIATLPAVRTGTGVLTASTGGGLSTSAVFARHDELVAAGARAAGAVTDELAAAFRSGLDGEGLAAWLPRLREANDLWPAASGLSPSLAIIRERLERHTGRPWPLTGSGSALFTLYPSADEAAAAGRAVAPLLATEYSRLTVIATDLDGPDPLWRYP